MRIMTQSQKKHLTYTKEPVSKIGETGGTVVYIFPGGKACVKKGKKRPKNSAPAHAKTANISTEQSDGSTVAEVDKAVKETRQQPSNTQTSEFSVDQSTQTTVQKVGDRLVQAEVINSTQLQVALYDQKTMNLRLGDILIARGWLDQATLDSVLSD